MSYRHCQLAEGVHVLNQVFRAEIRQHPWTKHNSHNAAQTRPTLLIEVWTKNNNILTFDFLSNPFVITLTGNTHATKFSIHQRVLQTRIKVSTNILTTTTVFKIDNN